MATIQDIADAVGISKAAVSRILNHKGSFSEETILKVFAEAKRLNYSVPSAARESVRMEDSKIIAAVFPATTSPYFGMLASLCEEEAYNYGYNLMLCGSLFNREKLAEVFDSLKKKRVSGIMLGGFADSEYLDEFSSMPLITVGYHWDDRITSVMSDSYAAGKLAARHLYHKGCRHPLYISAFSYGLKYDLRYQGYRDEFKKNGIEVSAYYCERHTMNRETMHGRITEMLLEHPEADGLFAESQSMSLTCLKVVLQMGYDVPGNIKVIGYGNTSAIDYCIPEITYVKENTPEIARIAVGAIVEMIEGEDKTPVKQMKVPVVLQIRQTT